MSDERMEAAEDAAYWDSKTTQELIEETLYTDQGMFGDIQFEAEAALMRRFPPPAWAAKWWELKDGYWLPKKKS